MEARARVAANLRRLRLAKGLSQEELAHLAEIDRNYVGYLELQKNAATVDMLDALANALQVDPAEFLAKTH